VVAPAAAAAPKKKFRVIRVLLIVLGLFVAFVLAYPLKDGNTACSAMQEKVTEQVPGALDILSARHPIAVGLLRSLLNDQGAVDKTAQDYVRSSMSSQDPSTPACYTVYYAIQFDPDAFRTALANKIEQRLNLDSPTNDTGNSGDGVNGGDGTSGSGDGSSGSGNGGNSN
jgi:hypothetical protein